MLSLNKCDAFVSGVSAAKQILSAVVLLLVLTIDVVATPWHLGPTCEYVTICKEELPISLPDFMEMVRFVSLLEHELRYTAQQNDHKSFSFYKIWPFPATPVATANVAKCSKSRAQLYADENQRDNYQWEWRDSY